jgi:hypothetical protein
MLRLTHRTQDTKFSTGACFCVILAQNMNDINDQDALRSSMPTLACKETQVYIRKLHLQKMLG